MGARFSHAFELGRVGEVNHAKKISLFLGLSLVVGVPLSHAQTLQEGSTCRLGDRAKLFTEATGDAFSVKLKSDAEGDAWGSSRMGAGR